MSGCVLQLLGLLGSPGKSKHANFERVYKSITDICWALRAELVIPQTHLADLEQRLHHAKVPDPFIMQHTYAPRQLMPERALPSLGLAHHLLLAQPCVALKGCECSNIIQVSHHW